MPHMQTIQKMRHRQWVKELASVLQGTQQQSYFILPLHFGVQSYIVTNGTWELAFKNCSVH